MFVILDVDRTLLHSNISYLFGKELYRKKYISAFTAICATFVYGLHYLKILSQESLHRMLFRLIFQNQDAASFQKLFHQFFTDEKGKLVREQFLKSICASYPKVILMSSSPDFIVQEIGLQLGIFETYGTQYQMKDGLFTSLGEILTGKNKLKCAQQMKKGPYAVYTDSSDDIKLLEASEIPIAVCPDRALFRYAQKKGWTIMFPSST